MSSELTTLDYLNRMAGVLHLTEEEAPYGLPEAELARHIYVALVHSLARTTEAQQALTNALRTGA